MSQKWLARIAAFIFLLLGLFLLLPGRERADLSSGTPAHPLVTPSLQKLENYIDRQLKKGANATEIQEKRTIIENQLHAPAVHPRDVDPLVRAPDEPIPLKLQGDDGTAKAYEDTVRKDPYQKYKSQTPEQRITNKVRRDQWEKEYQGEYEEEYMRTYIENAQRDGYDVKLNEKGEIVEVKYVGTEQPVRFPQSENAPRPESKKPQEQGTARGSK